MMIVVLSGRQTEYCRRKACFYTWKKSTQIKEFCSQGRNLQVNKHCDLFPKLCFRQTSALCYVLCVQTSAEWCRHVEQKIAPAAVLWPYQALINQAWHVLRTHFTSVYSRKFIIGNLHTQHIANTCFITATLFRILWKVSSVFFNTRNLITFQQLCCSWYKNEFCLLLANSMERNPCWETNQFSASQEIPHLLWNPKFPYPIRKCPSTIYLEPDRSSPYPPHSISWRSILMLNSHLRLCLPNGLFPVGFRTKTQYEPLNSPLRGTCPHILLDMFIR
jgi:hypothetical protein